MRQAYLPAVLMVLACGGNVAVNADASTGADARERSDGSVPDALRSDAMSPLLDEAPAGTLPDGPPQVKLLTYNLALLSTIKWAAERKPLLIDALRSVDADVMCLDEVWNEFTSPAQMALSLQPSFPYAYWTWAGQTVWGNGLLIVSKHPLYRGRQLVYAANDPELFVDRVILGVDVLMDDGYFHVLCTHLQAFYDPASTAIRLAEIDEIAAWSGAEGYLDGPTFLMGDFNCGPGTACDTCDPPDLQCYDRIQSTWTDPNVDWDQCTWCRAQAIPMQVLQSTSPTHRIDHCFYRNIGASTHLGTQLMFDEVVTFQAGSSTVMSTLSDHFGVRCVFGFGE